MVISVGPNNGALLSVMVGITTSIQMGFESSTLKKLHSFFVAADAACSSGDFPVAAVDARLAAVPGLATAAAPMLLAAAVPELLKATKGAAHPVRARIVNAETEKVMIFSVKKSVLLCAASNVINTSGP